MHIYGRGTWNGIETGIQGKDRTAGYLLMGGDDGLG